MLTNTANSFSHGERPNVVGNPSLSSPSIAEWFNTAAFAAPPTDVFGDAGRTFGRGPGAVVVPAIVRIAPPSPQFSVLLPYMVFAHGALTDGVESFTGVEFGAPASSELAGLLFKFGLE